MSRGSSPKGLEAAQGGGDHIVPSEDVAARESEIIGSLGEALAGVTLGTNVGPNAAFSFHDEHDSGAPFKLGSQATNASGDLGGWGFGSDPNAPLTTEDIKTTAADSVTQSNITGNQGIDLFLSKSPSQMLGNGVFLSSNNLTGIDMPQEGASADPFRQQPIGQVPPTFQTGMGQMTESPANFSGVGTSSRTSPPYHDTSEVGRTIQAYHGYYDNGNNVSKNEAPIHNSPSFREPEGAGGYPASSSGVQQPSIIGVPSPYFPNSQGMGVQLYSGFNNAGGAYDGGSMPGLAPKQIMSPANAQLLQASQQPGPSQQQQVLYMAVPTPDGRGQVLQPVQMVQLPGKPYAYVLPGQPGGMPIMQPGMQGMQSVMQPGMQAMMQPGIDPNQPPMMGAPNMSMQQSPLLHPSDIMSTMGAAGVNIISQGRNGFGSSSESDQYIEAAGSGNRGGGNSYVATDPDDAIASLYNSPERPTLDALLGQVRRLSRDQVGCRLVQQALDEEGASAATLILNEGLPFWGEAMVDPFGNYLFQKILEKITREERIMLIRSVSTRLVNASLNLHGTRSVQKIVELCAQDEGGNAKVDRDEESGAEILTASLAPAAARLCIDSHGNHVIQRILLKLEHKYAKFVFDAVAESVGDVARHRHGCCVIQRCLDSPPCPARSHLVRRIVGKSLELMQDAYGNYVIQYVLDVCSDEDVHAVCESVAGKVTLLAIQKFSSNVMEKCLERCPDRVKEQYLDELSDSERIRELMMDPFGNYVVQRALSVATHVQAVRLVEAMKPHLIPTQPGSPSGHRNGGIRNTAGGRRIMAKICRRFPNFNLNGVGTNDEIYSQTAAPQHRHHHPSSIPRVQPYSQMLPNGQQHHMPHHQQQQHHHHHQQQRYNMNPQAMTINMNMHQQQFDQRQPQAYFDMGDAGYFQHSSHLGNMGNGAYPSGF